MANVDLLILAAVLTTLATRLVGLWIGARLETSPLGSFVLAQAPLLLLTGVLVLTLVQTPKAVLPALLALAVGAVTRLPLLAILAGIILMQFL